MNLNQITVPVLNIESSIEFYKLLGLKLIVNSTNRYARFECPQGDSTFSLHKVDQLPIGEGVWIYFEVENLDEKFKELKNKGVDFLTNQQTKLGYGKKPNYLTPMEIRLFFIKLERIENIHLGELNN